MRQKRLAGNSTKRKGSGTKRVDKMEQAKKDFQELQKRIAPFVKPRNYEPIPTIGRWHNTSEIPAQADRSFLPCEIDENHDD